MPKYSAASKLAGCLWQSALTGAPAPALPLLLSAATVDSLAVLTSGLPRVWLFTKRGCRGWPAGSCTHKESVARCETRSSGSQSCDRHTAHFQSFKIWSRSLQEDGGGEGTCCCSRGRGGASASHSVSAHGALCCIKSQRRVFQARLLLASAVNACTHKGFCAHNLTCKVLCISHSCGHRPCPSYSADQLHLLDQWDPTEDVGINRFIEQVTGLEQGE